MVQWERQAVENNCARLTAEGFGFIVVIYEDFSADRQSFHENIFQFLGLPAELLPTSGFFIIIKDLRYTIDNYDAVVERAATMGIILEP